MATLSRMMNKAASSVIPLATRTPCRNYTSAIFTTPLKTSTAIKTVTDNSNLFRTTSIPTHRQFSALAKKKPDFDDTLLRVIDSEIVDAEEEAGDFEVTLIVGEAPSEFPFKIVDNDGAETITLTRNYQGEEIKVTVFKHDLSGDYEEGDEEDQDDQEANQGGEEVEEEAGSQPVDMVVTVTKKTGPTLEFDVMVEEDEITINNLAVKNPNVSDEDIAYEGPEFSLDAELQEAFHTYLEVRGIKPSIANFLHDYMVKKEHKEYTAWLKNLKNFIAN
ncbi:uncharacterized protein At2g39795, mitochondrial-like [Papaver somniferum]|uniref:uncharacterized protein At2g39795, mitochondrial-like n=1 Tax=Papaver somniferum TaxID=3469 RepID=UPI000E6F8FAD|nr:uncharacterized protein At2g39795, mitochondrial-like [Papaver somniferum]